MSPHGRGAPPDDFPKARSTVPARCAAENPPTAPGPGISAHPSAPHSSCLKRSDPTRRKRLPLGRRFSRGGWGTGRRSPPSSPSSGGGSGEGRRDLRGGHAPGEVCTGAEGAAAVSGQSGWFLPRPRTPPAGRRAPPGGAVFPFGPILGIIEKDPPGRPRGRRDGGGREEGP